jgi:hypothetical protein
MESYQRLIDVIAIENLQMRLEHWFLTRVLVWSTLGQIAAIAVALGLAYVLARPVRTRLASVAARQELSAPVLRGAVTSTSSIARASLAFVLLVGAYGVASHLGWPNVLLATAVNLIGAWIVIRLVTRLISNDFWSRVVPSSPSALPR